MAVIHFACKCGKQLQIDSTQGGRRVQCPDCGRALVAPNPVVEKIEPTWKVDQSADLQTKAESLGLLPAARGSAIRLYSALPLLHNLLIEGAFTCWHCRNPISFSGEVFGRAGFGGTFLTPVCAHCNARAWIGFSAHLAGKGSNVYLYAPTRSRGDIAIEAQTGAFRIHRLKEQTLAAEVEPASMSTLLLELTQAVNLKESFQTVMGLASNLTGQPMSPGQLEEVSLGIRALCANDPPLYLQVILVEALACLRDEGAAPTVRTALHNALAAEDAADAHNLPMQDLCALALLFGDGNGFMVAMQKGLADLTVPSRVLKMGKRLPFPEIARLIERGNHIDACESNLGGVRWQQVYPLVPLWLDEVWLHKEEEPRGWRKGVQKLFRPKRGKDADS